MRYELVCHPQTAASAIERVTVWVRTIDGQVNERAFEFHVTPAHDLAVPAMRTAARADLLWMTTCFEVFLQHEDDAGYTEVNLSPSCEWAAYAFDGYRQGMRNAALTSDPKITVHRSNHFFLDSDLDVSAFATGTVRMGLSAVIEETDGTKSYWALAHAPGPPDFHNRDCFTAFLPPPPR